MSRQLRVLVVDDVRDVADTCSMLVELSGHQARSAYGGSHALQLGEVFRPQVILSDIGLPDMDGYELAQRIRATPWGEAVVLVAVTGWGEAGRRERSLAAGFTHHLMKPIDPKMIEVLLESMA